MSDITKDWRGKKEYLRQAWKEFVTTGTIAPEKVRSVILKSWYNCVNAGISPYQKKVEKVLSGEEFEQLLEENEELINISMPVMENLYKFVAGSGFLVSLVERNGIILKIIGDQEVINSVKRGNFIEGADWSELSAGTNAIGTSLKTGKPLQVFAYEHFCICSHGSTCSSAPIHDPAGNLIGILDMTGTYEKVHCHTLGMVVAAANAIENCLVINQAQKSCQLANQYKSTIINSISEGLIATDFKGNITHLNNIAVNILGLKTGDLLGESICQILPEQNKDFFSIFFSGKYVTDEEVDIVTVNGRRKCTVTSRPIKNEYGIIEGTVVIINEIKRAKKIAQRMAGAVAKVTFADLIGKNKRFLQTVETAKLAATTNSNVLLLGESGTGKDVFAQAIHNESIRRNGPFIAINCAAIPRELIGSELFGYTEGAFTGAKRGGSPGKFELADGGTIFLDEIGEMPLELQTALLRVIEQKRLLRIGGQEIIPVDVRVIAATNKNLIEEVKKGFFRQDLFYRLNVITIEMIPLRERADDIPLLVEHFYHRLSKKLSKKMHPISNDYIKVLAEYNWPGNVRELQNVVERGIILSRNGTLELEFLPDELKSNSKTRSANVNLEEIERDVILNLLQTYDGNITRVANEMGIARTTLYRKIYKYGIKKYISA